MRGLINKLDIVSRRVEAILSLPSADITQDALQRRIDLKRLLENMYNERCCIVGEIEYANMADECTTDRYSEYADECVQALTQILTRGET